MNKVKFYTYPYSSNARRVEIMLEEKKIPYETIVVDLFKGEQKKPEYLAINPRGQVPALVDGDVTVYESNAINQYLEQAYPDPPLTPTNKVKFLNNPLIITRFILRLNQLTEVQKDLGLMLTRIHEFTQKLDQKGIFGKVVFGKMTKEQLKEPIEELKAELKVWDKHLEGREYLANTFSLADIAVLPFISVAIDVLGLPTAEYPNLARWYKNMLERESVKKTNRLSFWKSLGDFTSILA